MSKSRQITGETQKYKKLTKFHNFNPFQMFRFCTLFSLKKITIGKEINDVRDGREATEIFEYGNYIDNALASFGFQ